MQPSGRESVVERIVTYDGDLDAAVAGQSVTAHAGDEIDVSRGDVIAEAERPPSVGDQFEATIVWMAERAVAARPQLSDAHRHQHALPRRPRR